VFPCDLFWTHRSIHTQISAHDVILSRDICRSLISKHAAISHTKKLLGNGTRPISGDEKQFRGGGACTKTSVALDGAIIQCSQMRSAFWRGVTLLKELNSLEPDVCQHQGEPVAEAGPSTSTKGFSELLKKVMPLEPVTGKLMHKVAHE
jgi:hypothetical protein